MYICVYWANRAVSLGKNIFVFCPWVVDTLTLREVIKIYTVIIFRINFKMPSLGHAD